MKKLIITLLLLPLALAMSAQEARTLFVNMPDSLSPLLSAVNRADCIDFLDSKMRAQVTNTLGGKSEMTTLTPDYIRIQLTPKSIWQMKVLPLTDSTRVICTVATAYAPAPDSHIRFYNTDWHLLPTAGHLDALPAMNDFLLPPSDTANVYRQRDARRQADLLLLDASTSMPGYQEEIVAYARVGDSAIIYQISASDYEALMACSYDDLRHTEILPAELEDVSRVDVTLDGETYGITAREEDGELIFSYQDEDLETTDFGDALSALTAQSFTDQQPDQQEEISLTVYLDLEGEPAVSIRLCRYDGESCLAEVDGQPVALVARSQVVDLTEAVYAIVLGGQ